MLPYRRADRVGNQIRNEIAELVSMQMDDPRLKAVSITGVSLSNDLRHARVYFSVIGDPDQRDAAKSGLEHAAGRFKKAIAQKLKLRFVPELIFCFDSGLEHSQRIEDILQQINEEGKKED